MWIVRRSVWLASFLVTFAAVAQNSGPASNGDFQFSLTGATGAIEYNARIQNSGATTGEMTFTGTISISNEDVDGEGSTVTALTDVSLTVSFDCLRINGNRAAMSGVVTASSYAPYVGVHALLAVEDNGEGSKASARDKFTWGVYRHNAPSWIPSDAEVPGDIGATLDWDADDFEREDDEPIPGNQPVGPVTCQTFPFGSYAFEDVPHGAGNLQVKP